jgi:hypothetical protein
MSAKQSKPTPPFMQDDIGMGHEKIKADDVYWTGDGGNIDAGKLIRRSGYDPYEPLELLLLSVIAGHPDKRSTAIHRGGNFQWGLVRKKNTTSQS